MSEDITTFTPLMWLSMSPQQQFDEYIRVRALASASASPHPELKAAKEESEALRAQFAAFADQMQQSEIAVSNSSEWGHLRSVVLAMLSVLGSTARKMANGQPAYVPTYKRRAEEAEAEIERLRAASASPQPEKFGRPKPMTDDRLRKIAEDTAQKIEQATQHQPFADICSNLVERFIYDAIAAGSALPASASPGSGEPRELTLIESRLAAAEAKLASADRELGRLHNLFDNYGIPRFPLSATRARLQRMYRVWNVPGADVSLAPYTHDEWITINSALPASEGQKEIK